MYGTNIKAYRAIIEGTTTNYVGKQKFVIPVSANIVEVTSSFETASNKFFQNPLLEDVNFDRDNSTTEGRKYFKASCSYSKGLSTEVINVTEVEMKIYEIYDDASTKLVTFNTL